MCDQALEPRELVVEFRSRLWVAVGKVQRAKENAIYSRFDITRFAVAIIARQRSARFYGNAATSEQRHAMMRSLTAHNCSVACGFDGGKRKLGIETFDFLQGDDVGALFG